MTAADLRPLYVRGDASVVVARDGPALRITGDGRPLLRTPLRLLSRVVLAGRVRIEQAALVACMEARVPIAFLSASGQTRGWCFGVPREGERDSASDLDHSLRRFLATPEWRSALETWRDAAERRAILRLCRQGQRMKSQSSWVRNAFVL